MLRAHAAGLSDVGCLLGALLAERDPLQGNRNGADVGIRLQAIAGQCPAGVDVNRGAVQRILMGARQLSDQLKRVEIDPTDSDAPGE